MVKIYPLVQEKKIFEEFHMLLHVQSSLPCNSAINAHWGSIWTNLVHLQSRTLTMKFGWNLSTGSGEEDFWRVLYVSMFQVVSPVAQPAIKAHMGSIWTKFVHHQHRTLNIKCGWNLFTGQGEEDFWRISCYHMYKVLSPVTQPLMPIGAPFEQTWYTFSLGP